MPTRQKTFCIEGIVLRKRDHSEKDQIFDILTTENVKISVLAKHAKVVPSRHNSGLDLFNVVQCQLHTGKFLPIVVQCRQITGFPDLVFDSHFLEMGYKAIMATSALVPYEEKGDQTYERLLFCLRQFCAAKRENTWVVLIHFLVQMLESGGFIETSSVCQQCRVAFQDQVAWDGGRFLCLFCGRDTKNERLSLEQFRMIHDLVKQDFYSIPRYNSLDCQSLLSIVEQQIRILTQYHFSEKSIFALV